MEKSTDELLKIIEDLELKIQSLMQPDLSREGRILIHEDLKNRLPDTFRSHFPMYQFFRECGPLEAFAVTQSQMQIDNINLGITAVFLFRDEADLAAKWMKDRDTKGLSFKVLPTRITQFKGF